MGLPGLSRFSDAGHDWKYNLLSRFSVSWLLGIPGIAVRATATATLAAPREAGEDAGSLEVRDGATAVATVSFEPQSSGIGVKAGAVDSSVA